MTDGTYGHIVLLALSIAVIGILATRRLRDRGNDSKSCVPAVKLIHRGEFFQYTRGRFRFKGACYWIWRPPPHDGIRKKYLLQIDTRSITRTGLFIVPSLSKCERMEIARQVRHALQEMGYEVALEEVW
jgi:hypothetical protein